MIELRKPERLIALTGGNYEMGSGKFEIRVPGPAINPFSHRQQQEVTNENRTHLE